MRHAKVDDYRFIVEQDPRRYAFHIRLEYTDPRDKTRWFVLETYIDKYDVIDVRVAHVVWRGALKDLARRMLKFQSDQIDLPLPSLTEEDLAMWMTDTVRITGIPVRG